MTQSAIRLALFVVICAAFASAPAAARPGGGGHGGGGHGGGGFARAGGGGFAHGGGGGGRAFAVPQAAPRISVPHFAPRVSVPHFAPGISAPRISAPRIAPARIAPQVARVPHISGPRSAPQHVARPQHVAPRQVVTGNIPAAHTFAGAARSQVTPGQHASRAFALAGAHGAAGAHIVRNQFFANRPGVARTTFHGRFAQLPLRHHHHRHFRPIVIGWFGPLFWPYAYDDFLGYTFYPYAYDAFWPAAYDDVYDGMFGLYEGGIPAAYAATGAYAATSRQPAASGGRIVAHQICSGQTAGVTYWQIDEIARAVEPDNLQRAALDEIKSATAQALDILKAACPTELPSTPTGRIEAMHARLAAMLEAVRTVRAPLAKFNSLLSDEQKARFNALGSGDDRNEPQTRRDLTQACNERASGIAGLPIERVERAVRPDEAQRATLADLRTAISEAGELLKSNCPTYRPLTPVVRLDAMEQRLDAMLRAVETVRPALAKFYGSLSDEQKERFNQLGPAQG
jgi:hypothetical protein